MEGVHAIDNLSSVLSMGYPSESGAPGRQNLPEGPVHGESKGAIHQRAALGPSEHDRGELFEESIEVTSSESEVVHSKRDETFGCVELNRLCRSSILSELVVFCLTDKVIGAFR